MCAHFNMASRGKITEGTDANCCTVYPFVDGNILVPLPGLGADLNAYWSSNPSEYYLLARYNPVYDL